MKTTVKTIPIMWWDYEFLDGSQGPQQQALPYLKLCVMVNSQHREMRKSGDDPHVFSKKKKFNAILSHCDRVILST